VSGRAGKMVLCQDRREINRRAVARDPCLKFSRRKEGRDRRWTVSLDQKI
jgi:hypothetical protein